MPSRRKFMQHGLAAVAAAALPASSGSARIGAAYGKSVQRPFLIVFDGASAEGAAFGHAAATRGAPVRNVPSDIGPVWMRVLEPRLRQGPAAIAGLTAGAPLFCLEYLTRAYGLSLVYRIEHAETPGGRRRHRLTGPAALAPWDAALERDGDAWPGTAAALAAACPVRTFGGAGIPLLDLSASGTGPPRVFSWLLAPHAVNR